MFGTVGNYFLLTWVNVSHWLKGIWLLSHWVRVHTQAPSTPAPHWGVQPKPTFEMWKMIQFSVITKKNGERSAILRKEALIFTLPQVNHSFVHSSPHNREGSLELSRNKKSELLLYPTGLMQLLAWYIYTNAVRTGVVQYWHVAWCLPCSWPAARQSVADQ